MRNTLKTSFTLILALVMLLSAAGCAASRNDPNPPATEAPAASDAAQTTEPALPVTGDDYLGYWQWERASLDITRDEDGGYYCLVHWGSGATESTSWQYHCKDENGVLVCSGKGKRTDFVFDNEGKMKSETAAYTDGKASFTLKNGRITWKDEKQDSGRDASFELLRPLSEAPTPEEFADDYFRVLGSVHPGTAGATLAEAVAASKILAFAVSHELQYNDLVTMRANMLKGWESLTKDEQKAFDASFISVVKLIDACYTDWKANKGRFTDAGVAEEMETFMDEYSTIGDWSRLKGNTLTMGNSAGL